MNSLPPTLTDVYRVRSYEVGPDEESSLVTMANYLQETAGHHASALKLGPDHLIPKGIFWVLSRLRLELDTFFKAQEELSLLTWPSALDRHIACRDFRIFDRSEKEVGVATTAWLVFDLETRKMIEVPEWIGESFPDAPPRNLDFETRTLPRLRDATFERKIDVRRADLDMLGHVNNVHYLEWALEAVPEIWWDGHKAVEGDIQFRAEAQAGDRIASRCSEEGEGRFLHTLVREVDGVEVARARTKWVART